jgi:hypothetical protein
MKSKHYIWTFALLGLTACGSEADSVMPGIVEEEPIQVIPNKNIPIQFGLSEQANTRADGTYYVEGHQNNVIPAGRKVGVFGYYQGYEEWETSPMKADFFYNEPMTVETPLQDSKTTDLTYSPLRFWPNGNQDGKEEMLSFYAYYPYVEDDAAATALGLEMTKEKFLMGQGEFVFTCKDKASKQIDFMISVLDKNQKRSDYLDGDKRVPMTFYHQLSRILININIDPATETTIDSDNNATVVTLPRVYDKVAEVKVVGVHKRATFIPSKIEDRAKWEIPLNDNPIRLVGDVTIDNLPGTNQNLVGSPETALLLIPQRCQQETHKIVIKLHKVGQGTEDNDENYKTFTVALTDLWLSGRDYEYNFRVSETDELQDTTDFRGNAGIPEDGGLITNS